MENSTDSEFYNSDEIDSDIEVSLYGLIHHNSDHQLFDTTNDQSFDHKSNHLNEIQSKSSVESNANCLQLNNNKISSNSDSIKRDFIFNDKNENNLKNVKNNNSNETKIECIEIEDSSEDSDVVIISDNTKNREKKWKRMTNIDISLANVNNLKESTLLEMNQFYDEDVYDSEQEVKAFQNMTNDRNMWKISNNDILLSNRQNNRYYLNRFICKNCSERGHKMRECPLPKKSPTCYLCGLTGHQSEKCKSILCSNCFSSRHKTRFCNVSVDHLVCDECGRRGHETNQCTYNWRKYHLTTTPDSEPIVCKLKANKTISCYNCGAYGKHFGHECHKKTLNQNWSPIASPLMSNPKRVHCFNEKESKRSHHSFCNNGNISTNELSSGSASFDITLSEFDLTQTRTTSNNSLNKHIKWIYPQTNSSPILRNCKKNGVIIRGKRLNDSVPEMHSLLNSAHTLTHEEINNSMLGKSRTPKRSKRKNRHQRNGETYRRNSETQTNGETHQLKETNISLNEIKRQKMRQKQIRRRVKRRLNKKFANFSNNSNNF